jgi:membrane-associated phospholipid phosphatase
MTAYGLKISLAFTCFSFVCNAQPSGSPALPDSSSAPSVNRILAGSAGAIVVTAVLLHYDQQIYNNLYTWKTHNQTVKDISPIITKLGDGAFSIGLFGGFIGYGLISENNKAVEAGKIGMESFLLTGITVQIFKHLCGRERPSDATRPGGFWHGPFAYFRHGQNKGISSFDAFPSGHTVTVFSAATVISDFYTDPWVSYTSYSLATLVAVSRITESTHWISDCFVGAIIGYCGTRLVEKLNYGSGGIALMPRINDHQYGLLLSMKL